MVVRLEAGQGDLMAATLDESRLRYPTERVVYVATLLLNIVVLVAVAQIIRLGEDWRKEYQFVSFLADGVELSGAALLLAPVALTLLRNRRRGAVRANALRLGSRQIPEIYEDYAALCTALGVSEPPELYVIDQGLDEPSMSTTTWSDRFIALNARFLDRDLESVRPVYRFLMARELGRIRLGHTDWLDELLIAHVMRVPLLRNPLLHARTYSHDRYGAALAPDAVRGLIVVASGRHMLSHVDVEEYLSQAREVTGWRSRLAQLSRGTPFVAMRIQALDRAGMAMTDVVVTTVPTARADAAVPSSSARLRTS